MKRICVFNAKFSPNLGDGLLAECMEKCLTELGYNKDNIYVIDTAARTEYMPGKASRSLLLKILHNLPDFLRRWILFFPLTYIKQKKWLPFYKENLKKSDALIIGGGNLFTDMDLNFPTKISAVLNEANRLKLPIYVYGVGVGYNWSEKGREMVANSLKAADLRYFSVRDNDSKSNLLSIFSDVLKVEPIVVRDPGLLASKYLLETPIQSVAKDNTIGLCITCSSAVNYHSELVLTESYLLNWYVNVCKILTENNFKLMIFTNGSPEDVKFALNLIGKIDLDNKIEHNIHPKNPTEIVNTISNMRAVVAFRMHALIAAYSNNIDIFALKWDPKLDSFMKSIGKENRLFSITKNSPNAIAHEIMHGLKEKNNEDISSKIVEEAFTDMKFLVKIINS